MPSMFVTLDTSQLEMSPSNTEEWNNQLISVTAETSQDPIGSCEPSAQSVDSFKHSAIWALSSAFDLGAQAVVVVVGEGLRS